MAETGLLVTEAAGDEVDVRACSACALFMQPAIPSKTSNTSITGAARCKVCTTGAFINLVG